MKSATLFLMSLAPTLMTAMPCGNGWSFDSASSEGLSDITFPMNIANAPHEVAYYFSQQFGFMHGQEGGYIGLQPRPDFTSGASVVHVVFSTFRPGATSSHANCHPGADTEPGEKPEGVSCGVDIEADYNKNYNLTVENVSGDTWKGLLVDTVTSQTFIIGEWTLPAASGKIKSSDAGFVEYYIWNQSRNPTLNFDCSIMPKTEVTFGIPTTRTQGVGPGSLTDMDEDGHCIGNAGLSASRTTSDELVIRVGRQDPSCQANKCFGAMEHVGTHSPSDICRFINSGGSLDQLSKVTQSEKSNLQAGCNNSLDTAESACRCANTPIGTQTAVPSSNESNKPTEESGREPLEQGIQSKQRTDESKTTHKSSSTGHRNSNEWVYDPKIDGPRHNKGWDSGG